jgi:hypothetical protein
MATAERVLTDVAEGASLPEPGRLRPVPQTPPTNSVPRASKSRILGRLIRFYVGFGFVMLGWPLAVSAVGSFIGIPLIIFGLGLMQAQER